MERAELIPLDAETGPSTGFVLEAECTRIGRAEDNDIVLADRAVSRHHARILREGAAFRIENVVGRNPILLNDSPVEGARIFDHDRIRIGRTDFVFRCEAAAVGRDPAPDGTFLTIDARNRNALLSELDAGDLPGAGRARGDLAALYRAGQVINASLSSAELAERTLETILTEMSQVDSCSLHLLDTETQALQCLAQKYRQGEPADSPRMFSRTLLATVVNEMKGVLTYDAQEDGRFQDAQSILAMNVRAAMCVPIQAQGRLTGVLQAHTIHPGHSFKVDDLKLLTAFGMLAGVAIQNAMLYEKLEAEKARETERARTLQVMVHELKSPIAGARTMAETLRMQLVPAAEHPHFLGRIVARLDAMLEWINDALNLSKIKSGAIAGEPAQIDLCARVRQAVEEYREQAAGKGLRLEAVTPPTPMMILMEPNSLHLVISNLISNAIKYTPEGNVGIALEADEGQAVLQVKDSGMGIPEQDLPRLFEEFFRASNARKSKIEGSGVGLAGVRHIVERARGTIAVASVEGQGTTFTVRLPVSPEAQ